MILTFAHCLSRWLFLNFREPGAPWQTAGMLSLIHGATQELERKFPDWWFIRWIPSAANLRICSFQTPPLPLPVVAFLPDEPSGQVSVPTLS